MAGEKQSLFFESKAAPAKGFAASMHRKNKNDFYKNNRRRNVMGKIKVGLLGFGRTGKIVANEIITSPAVSLQWVIRQHRDEENYASHLLGYDFEQGTIWGKDDIAGEFSGKIRSMTSSIFPRVRRFMNIRPQPAWGYRLCRLYQNMRRQIWPCWNPMPLKQPYCIRRISLWASTC